jgi:hypothetical protein
MKPPVINPEASYTFFDYFKLVAEVEDILAYFGYSFQVRDCTLPHHTVPFPILTNLKARLIASLPYISLTSETARREFLIAPVLMEVIQYTQVKIKVEFPIEVNAQLKGTFDYYLQAQNSMLVIEAKQGDLQKGFTQLAVELIALDKWIESAAAELYGAVTLGDIWRFGILNRPTKLVTQDLNLYRVPADLEELVPIIVAILTKS